MQRVSASDRAEARRAAANAEATFFDDPAAFREWLGDHAGRSKGLWIRFADPGSGVEGGTHAEAVDEALCFGWVETETVKDDDDRFTLRRFTPRAPKAPWSQADRDRAQALAAEGRLDRRGLDELDTAREDGRLDAAYAPVEMGAVPDDLAAALDAVPAARTFFDEVDDRNRSAILHRVGTAADPETRARRIATFVDMLAGGEKLYPRRPKAR